ncbi:MAG: glycoside hydrolase family 20 zincin-like fold domain-containing protein [Acidimicrobiales bacterium]
MSLLPRPRRAQLDPAVTVSPTLRFGTDSTLPAQGYRLRVESDGTATLAAADETGRFYGQATLAQLRADDGRVPVGTVEDWPDFAVRGVMLDVSRTKVPTLETLFDLVERLASWKVNHFELYMEHTFAHDGHEVVWQGADPYDADDMARLGRFCADRHVELAANQNCLGHMDRWLLHDRYAALGIRHGVVSGPMGLPWPASTFDPANPEAFALAAELLGTMTSVFPAGRIHVGMDEPWDLPADRAGEWRLWLDRLRVLPSLGAKELLVWGDMVTGRRGLLDGWPEGVTVCEWGYEAGHPFAERNGALAEAAVPHWVCPGTSSWMSVLGRTSNALANCREAAAAGVATGAAGMLVTDWGDFGHLQYPAVSDPALALAAAVSWCADTNAGLGAEEIGALLDRHCYAAEAAGMGSAIAALGDVHLLQPARIPNMSALVLHLYFPHMPVGRLFNEELSREHLEAVDAALDDALTRIDVSGPRTAHGRLATDELAASARLVQILGADARHRLQGDGTIASIPESGRKALAADVDDLIGEHRRLWLRRNRPGGLDESCRWLEHLRDCYAAGEADPAWAGPVVERLRRQEAGS